MNRITVDINVNEDGAVDSFIKLEVDKISYAHLLCGLSSLVESVARQMSKDGVSGITKEEVCSYIMELPSKTIVKN